MVIDGPLHIIQKIPAMVNFEKLTIRIFHNSAFMYNTFKIIPTKCTLFNGICVDDIVTYSPRKVSKSKMAGNL